MHREDGMDGLKRPEVVGISALQSQGSHPVYSRDSHHRNDLCVITVVDGASESEFRVVLSISGSLLLTNIRMKRVSDGNSLTYLYVWCRLNPYSLRYRP